MVEGGRVPVVCLYIGVKERPHFYRVFPLLCILLVYILCFSACLYCAGYWLLQLGVGERREVQYGSGGLKLTLVHAPVSVV